ncbi:hypothetical protein ACFS5N_08580 [Mucilaginibacter ximonensis]|uniref:O-antigen ligase n=1 Tax=Mucilaginibacter ximonensis TaxID=538021 RepID=A0ABW5YAV5_9SPHI
MENKFFLPILFYVFDSFVFCALVYVLNKNFEKVASHLALAIIISLSIQAILALAHIGTGRGSLYFNNPNQLGYYALTSLTVFACLPSVYRSNKLMTMAVLILSSYLILYSGSRAALLGVILLGSIIFVKEGFKVDASSIAFIILVIGAGWYFFNRNDFVDAQIKSIQDRQESKSSQGVSEFEVRGYDRFYLAPEYVLYGAGEGKYDRFHSYHSLEMHSGPGTILFSYGVLGFYLFFSFVAIVIKRDLFNNSLLIAPVILYNFTHQGFRESLFWILLACIFMVSSKQYVKDVFLKVRKHGHFEFLK